MRTQSYDVLVIGGGAAGLRAAIAAGEAGARVGVLSKGSPGKKTATILSGGFFAGSTDDKTAASHRRQTLAAGRGINQVELVKILVDEGPERIEELIDWGIKAEASGGRLFALGRSPLLGRAIVDCLISRCSHLGIEFLPRRVVTAVSPRLPGFAATACDAGSGEWNRFIGKAIVLATGGAAALYERHDNPGRMLGDGWLLALDAGAVLQDLEFVQFYPLGLFEPRRPAFLIPPRLADLGRLYNDSDQDIFTKYGISERPAGERARDKLSQALFAEVYRDNRAVWLDATSLSEAQWRGDPFSAATYDILGDRYGARHRPVRVSPIAHHTMGGVVIDSHGGTDIPGFYAAGEVTGGLHGSNRMGGNALTETMVFGRRAGQAAAAFALRTATVRSEAVDDGESRPAPASRTGGKAQAIDPFLLLKDLRRAMWLHGGISRTAGGLEELLSVLRTMKARLNDAAPPDPRRVARLHELRFAVRAAELIAGSALRRAESRGAHHRRDCPVQDDERWQGHQQVSLDPGGSLKWRFQPRRSHGEGPGSSDKRTRGLD